MRLSKYQMYFALHVVFIGAVLLYQSLWLFSKTTEAAISGFDRMASQGDYKHGETMTVRYVINYKSYEKTFIRNATPFAKEQLS